MPAATHLELMTDQTIGDAALRFAPYLPLENGVRE